MEFIEEFMNSVDLTLNSKSKRHVMGGILLSMSFLFGGLALTIITMRDEKREEDE